MHCVNAPHVHHTDMENFQTHAASQQVARFGCSYSLQFGLMFRECTRHDSFDVQARLQLALCKRQVWSAGYRCRV